MSPSARAAHDMAYDTGSDRIILFGGLTESGSLLGDTWAYDVDHNIWTNMNPAASPSARSSHAMAYDATADRVVLFGGVVNVGGTFVEVNDTWAYDFNSNTWTNRNPAAAPSPRLGHRMAYDAQSGRTVLLSGHRGQGGSAILFHDTWTYDFSANEWTDMAPSVSPAAGNHGSLVYDTESDRIVQFGGESSSGVYSDETWAYNFDTNSWTESLPSARPSPRFLHAMAYDADSDRIVLFGGSSGSDETWVFSLNANEWGKVSPSSRPSGRLGHRMAYDQQSDRAVLFGGGPSLFGPYKNETWAYDCDANEWIPVDVPSRPLARSYHAMAYDTGSDRVVLFSGIVEFGATVDTLDSATWTYDLNTNTWTEANPAPWPPPLAGHTMAYDSKSDRVVLTGGCTSCPPSPFVGNPDTWAYDVGANVWARMPAGPHPPGMIGGRVAYDAESDRVVLFGGLSTSLTFLDATWAYDFDTNTWMDMNPSTRPPARNYAGMAYDAESDRVILFGGSPTLTGQHLGDTWSYDFNTNTWTDMRPILAPSPRNYQGMVYDSQSDRVTLFGGNPGETETWAYNYNSNTWTNMNPASPPQGRSRHGMAYDSESDRTILFGGWRPPYAATNDELLGDTWTYDLETNAWKPMIAPPTTPQTFAATPGTLRIDLAWSAPSFDGSSAVSGYRIYRGTSFGTISLFADLGVVLMYRDTNVTAGTTYYYQVSAVNEVGESPLSNRVFAAPNPDTTNPTVAITSPATGTTLTVPVVTVTGTAADDVAVEKVELSLDGTNWIDATGTTSWSGTLTLQVGSNTITARATDTSGNEATTSITVTVPPPPPPPPPWLLIGVAVAGVAAAGVVAGLLVRRRKKRA